MTARPFPGARPLSDRPSGCFLAFTRTKDAAIVTANLGDYYRPGDEKTERLTAELRDMLERSGYTPIQFTLDGQVVVKGTRPPRDDETRTDDPRAGMSETAADALTAHDNAELYEAP